MASGALVGSLAPEVAGQEEELEMTFAEWVTRWEAVIEERKRSAEYEEKYQEALRRFNSDVISVNGRQVILTKH